MSELMRGFMIQKRVILALMLRETHTIYGDSKLGYLWVVIQSAFGIAVFWMVRSFRGFSPPHGMPLLIFLIVGFGVWNVTAQSINKCMSAVNSNRPLLTFPQVTEFDVLVARVIVLYVTQIVVTLFFILIAMSIDIRVELCDPGLLFICLFLIPAFGLGCGLFLSSLAVFVEVLKRIIPMTIRLLFFVSGIFFEVSRFGADIAQILSYNPILQLVELTRCALSYSYPRNHLSVSYVVEVTLVLLSLGLLLERYVRGRRER